MNQSFIAQQPSSWNFDLHSVIYIIQLNLIYIFNGHISAITCNFAFKPIKEELITLLYFCTQFVFRELVNEK